MAKLFTITEGLENMGALKTGGQGSVYKGRRLGQIITAIKILPTPIHSESSDDKNYIDFQNEVQKLKKVNEQPNPHVVTILSSGMTDSGNLPFIEMEYIDGTDLQELLKPPHDAVFTIKEVLKVAEQLSNALAHCHKVDVKHGDVKSNNVKFNSHTGNYMLLDFGLALMSDEERRSSMRHAGAIEFMAPEQNAGQMLLQTDVYSFGVVLYELLTGIVPFPLKDKGETTRNSVMVAHMETLPPDVLMLRRENLPATWSPEKKQHEMQVPEWLIEVIYKCLEKKPSDRFKSGVELYEYIVLNSILSAKKDEAIIEQFELLKVQAEKLQEENGQLQKQVLQHHQHAELRDVEIEKLRTAHTLKDEEIKKLRTTHTLKDEEIKKLHTRHTLKDEELQSKSATPLYNDVEPGKRKVSRLSFIILLIITIALGTLYVYQLMKGKPDAAQTLPALQDSAVISQRDSASSPGSDEPYKNNNVKVDTGLKKLNNAVNDKIKNAFADSSNENDGSNLEQSDPHAEGLTPVKYRVPGKAFFYDKPDQSTRRSAFIVHWNNAVLSPTDEQGDFVYVVFTNHLGQTSRGWLRKKDLVKAP